MPPLVSEWESFYVITGSSGAALTGLMFVVVALAADRQRLTTASGANAFSTPNVVHFAMVLLVASIMTMPRHGMLSLGLCLFGCAVGGLILTFTLGIRRMRKVTGYVPVAEDWIWHAVLPCVAYAALLAGALMLGAMRETALYMVAGVVLLLLYIGIHNAWDAALYLMTLQSVGDAK